MRLLKWVFVVEDFTLLANQFSHFSHLAISD